MFYLEDILGQGYQAHVLLYRSENRAQDATRALSVTVTTPDDSTSVLIQDLVGGDISAQARTLYNSNLAVSLVQTLDLGAEMISESLNDIQHYIERAATGVYSSLDLAQFQIKISDEIRDLNRSACRTEFRGQKLLCTDQQDITLYMDNAFSFSVPSVDLQFSGEGVNVQENVSQARQIVSLAQQKTEVYRQVLADKLQTLQHQIGLADTKVAQTMGYGLGEPNDQVAQALAQEVVSEILSESVASLQAQANVTGNRAAWLFNGTLRSPNFPSH